MAEQCRILNVRIHRVALDAVRARLDAYVRDGGAHQVVTVNMDFLRLACGDAAFREALNAADLSVPDGVPVLWAARLLGEPLGERVTGVDIVEQGAALAAERGYRIFLLGAEPGVAAAAADELRRRHPGLLIAGTYAPPFGPFSAAEDARIVALVRAARPDMLFVAFGAPRQDVWLHRHRHELGVPVMAGVGGTFNFLAGRVPRAPRWMQRHGLEWAYRLRQEPRRLWRRYLLGDLPVLLRIVLGRMTPAPPLRRRLLALSPVVAPAPVSIAALVDVEAAAGD
jgi:N-acetylglucosaminyldiphosphoundecaprenol N-acetyl-beta-D-mannosaminyltransferase